MAIIPPQRKENKNILIKLLKQTIGRKFNIKNLIYIALLHIRMYVRISDNPPQEHSVNCSELTLIVTTHGLSCRNVMY